MQVPFPDVRQFVVQQEFRTCGLLANNFERMPAAALRNNALNSSGDARRPASGSWQPWVPTGCPSTVPWKYALGDLHAESVQTVQGSLSAVSKPVLAIKYSLESFGRALLLHNALRSKALQSHFVFELLTEFAEILPDFDKLNYFDEF